MLYSASWNNFEFAEVHKVKCTVEGIDAVREYLLFEWI